MQYKYVIYEKKGEIAYLTLNKPDKLNCLSFVGLEEDMQNFVSALNEAADDDEVKVLVIKGAGKAFCAGQDLTRIGRVYGMGEGKPGGKRVGQLPRIKMDRKSGILREVLNHPKVTLAQVHGYCIGGGENIVQYCDLAIASDDAVFGHPGNRLGTPVIDLTHILSVGLKRAMWSAYLGGQITAQEAATIGLINKVVPRDKLEEEVNKVAEALTLLARDAIAVSKQARRVLFGLLGMEQEPFIRQMEHVIMTNMHFEPHEFNFLKMRRDKGTTKAIHDRDDHFEKPLKD